MSQIFIGKTQPLAPRYSPSGIFKQPVLQPLWLGREGLQGDQQADRRVHGGPEKAVHQFPVGRYAELAAAFPEAAARLVPGSMGENLSIGTWTESSVCIGDVFQWGGAKVQVSQPRSPCWKIDARFEQDGMAAWIDEQGASGWYFRVLEEGEVVSGCDFALIERAWPALTLANFWQLKNAHRPDPAALLAVADIPALSPNAAEKFRRRAEWLLENAY